MTGHALGVIKISDKYNFNFLIRNRSKVKGAGRQLICQEVS